MEEDIAKKLQNSSAFSVVEKNSKLYKKIANQIAEQIQNGTYPANSRLPPEREIASQMNVSRPSLREALIALEIMGLVEIKAGSGIYVTYKIQNSNDDTVLQVNIKDKIFFGASVFEVLDARMTIEGEVVAIATRNPSSKLIKDIQYANTKMLEDYEHNHQDVTYENDGDYLFHRAIAENANNQVLKNIITKLWKEMRNPLFAHINSALRLKDNALKAIEDHKRIVYAISKKNPINARKEMHRHILNVKNFLMKDLQ